MRLDANKDLPLPPPPSPPLPPPIDDVIVGGSSNETVTSTSASNGDNLSGNSNENTETTDNTVRELDLNGSGSNGDGHGDGSSSIDDVNSDKVLQGVGMASATKRINSTESATSNVTIEETIYIPIEKNLSSQPSNESEEEKSGEELQQQKEEEEEDIEQMDSLRVVPCKAPPNSFETSDTLEDTDVDVDLIEYIVTYEESESDTLQRRGSCLSRGGSSKNSIKKKVNLNESAEIIPPPPPITDAIDTNNVEKQHSIEDDDEVFSDSVPPKLPRGNMCTPFVVKRGSIPGLAALPDWFREEK